MHIEFQNHRYKCTTLKSFFFQIERHNNKGEILWFSLSQWSSHLGTCLNYLCDLVLAVQNCNISNIANKQWNQITKIIDAGGGWGCCGLFSGNKKVENLVVKQSYMITKIIKEIVINLWLPKYTKLTPLQGYTRMYQFSHNQIICIVSPDDVEFLGH